MKTLTLDEIHKSQIETMKIVRDFCDAHNIKYYLSSGTLLGAVRHKGFIPWDDDADFFMEREDLNYLIDHFNEHRIQNREILSKGKTPDYPYSFAKVVDRNTVVIERGTTLKIGVWVDIFPLDYLKDNIKPNTHITRKIGRLTVLSNYSGLKPEKRRPFYKNLIIRLFKIFVPSRERIIKKRAELMNQITSPARSNNFGWITGPYGLWGIPVAPRRMFDPSIKLEFEGELFDAPKDYKNILIFMYGRNYMKMPPKNKRRAHNYLCYWKKSED